MQPSEARLRPGRCPSCGTATPVIDKKATVGVRCGPCVRGPAAKKRGISMPPAGSGGMATEVLYDVGF